MKVRILKYLGHGMNDPRYIILWGASKWMCSNLAMAIKHKRRVINKSKEAK